MSLPQTKVRVWAPDNTTFLPADATVLPILGGSVPLDAFDITREFSFDLPLNYNLNPNDYTPPSGQTLQSGSWVELATVLSYGEKVWFFGRIKNYSIARAFIEDAGRSIAVARYKALDPLNAARGRGINRSWATRMKVYEATFDSTDFDASDPFFLVNLPDNSEDWVESGLISLTAKNTTGGLDDESQFIDYGRDEFEYSAGLKQLYFKSSQEEPQPDQPQADFQWTVRLYYYDPADTDHTVTKLLYDIFTAAVRSNDGGFGFAGADVDLEEIYGFDGVTPKRVRSFNWKKTDGPLTTAIDNLRDRGLIPRNYRIYYDPAVRKVKGRFLDQLPNGDPGILVLRTLSGGVRSENMPYSLDGAPLRVECWAEAITPQNLALPATVTLNPPADYITVPDDATTAKANIHDGKPGTFLQFQKELKTMNYDVVSTANDCIVLDLGAIRAIGKVNFRGSSPKEPADAGEFRDIPHYHDSRLPRITVSIADALTDDTGTPVSPESINAQYTPHEVDDYADLEWEATFKQSGRYIYIRWEQDYFYRRDGNNIGRVARQSNFSISEIRVFGDTHFRYPDGDPNAGAVPFVQLTEKGNDISGIASLVLTVGTHKFAVNDYVQFWDTSGALPFVMDPVPTVTAIGATTVTVSAVPGGLVTTDKIGAYKRWVKGLAGDWIDLYAPKRVAKLYPDGWEEHITGEAPGSIEEAEQLCVERLLELSKISHDHEAEILLNHTSDIGDTNCTYSGRTAWLVTRLTLNINGYDESADSPVCTLHLGGANYQEALQ